MGFRFNFAGHLGLEKVFYKVLRPYPKAHSGHVQIHSEKLNYGEERHQEILEDIHYFNIRLGHQAII